MGLGHHRILLVLLVKLDEAYSGFQINSKIRWVDFGFNDDDVDPKVFGQRSLSTLSLSLSLLQRLSKRRKPYVVTNSWSKQQQQQGKQKPTTRTRCLSLGVTETKTRTRRAEESLISLFGLPYQYRVSSVSFPSLFAANIDFPFLMM